MRPRNPLDSRIDCEPEMGTPATISTARFPVIHGPMRAAPLWHARIGRWVTGDAPNGTICRRADNLQVMNRKHLVVQSCPGHIDQMAMMRKDQDLPAFGEARQRAQHIRCAFVVRGDEHVIEHERHVRV